VEYGPTNGDRHLTVFVDPGHGGPDPGATAPTPGGSTVGEKTVTLAVALDLLPILRDHGYHVVLSRIDDSSVARITPRTVQGGGYTLEGEHADIAARAHCANEGGARLLLSIHFNSFFDPSADGPETLYDPARPFSAQSLRFAGLVQRFMVHDLTAAGVQVTDRGVLSDAEQGAPALSAQAASYGHLLELGPAKPGWFDHPSTMPGALSEPLFLTNPDDQRLATSVAGQKAMARAFAGAIDSYFKRAA
jgi:N-acetylmuramoyl-L-alanine amidase